MSTKCQRNVQLHSGNFPENIALNNPTGPFTISVPHNQAIVEFCVVAESRDTDFKARKWARRSVGNPEKNSVRELGCNQR